MSRVSQIGLKPRSGGSNSDESITWYRYRCPTSGGATVVDGTYNSVESLDNSYFEGYDIPDYHRKLREGKLLPHTPFRTFACTGGSVGRYEYNHSNGYTYWCGPNTLSYDSWQLTEEEILNAVNLSGADRFVQESAAKIYSNGFDALTFIAELDEVVKQFKNVLKLFRKLSALKNWRTINSEYLGTRYGWRVLIYDLIGLDKAIHNLSEARTRYSERSGDQYSWTTLNTSNFSWSAFGGKIDTETRYEVSRRGSVVADIEVPAFQFNPLQSGWELIPLSFVLDWVVGVGTALSALSFAARQKAYTASTGYRIKVTRSMSAYCTYYTSKFVSGYGFTQQGQANAEVSIRQPANINYIPHLAVKLNGMKVLDLLALTLQRLK